jgi:hypothetical protein
MEEVVDAMQPGTAASIYQSPASSLLSLHSVTISLTQISAQDNLMDIARHKARLPCYVHRPYVENPDFVGREQVVESIGNKLLPVASVQRGGPRLFTMVGLAGMGKTQTALHFMFKHKGEFQGIFWASADSRTKLTECFVDFAVELGLVENHTADQQAAVDAVKSWLDIVGK